VAVVVPGMLQGQQKVSISGYRNFSFF